jgi:hypothetical protein
MDLSPCEKSDHASKIEEEKRKKKTKNYAHQLYFHYLFRVNLIEQLNGLPSPRAIENIIKVLELPLAF